MSSIPNWLYAIVGGVLGIPGGLVGIGAGSFLGYKIGESLDKDDRDNDQDGKITTLFAKVKEDRIKDIVNSINNDTQNKISILSKSIKDLKTELTQKIQEISNAKNSQTAKVLQECPTAIQGTMNNFGWDFICYSGFTGIDCSYAEIKPNAKNLGFTPLLIAAKDTCPDIAKYHLNDNSLMTAAFGQFGDVGETFASLSQSGKTDSQGAVVEIQKRFTANFESQKNLNDNCDITDRDMLAENIFAFLIKLDSLPGEPPADAKSSSATDTKQETATTAVPVANSTAPIAATKVPAATATVTPEAPDISPKTLNTIWEPIYKSASPASCMIPLIYAGALLSKAEAKVQEYAKAQGVTFKLDKNGIMLVIDKDGKTSLGDAATYFKDKIKGISDLRDVIYGKEETKKGAGDAILGAIKRSEQSCSNASCAKTDLNFVNEKQVDVKEQADRFFSFKFLVSETPKRIGTRKPKQPSIYLNIFGANPVTTE